MGHGLWCRLEIAWGLFELCDGGPATGEKITHQGPDIHLHGHKRAAMPAPVDGLCSVPDDLHLRPGSS